MGAGPSGSAAAAWAARAGREVLVIDSARVSPRQGLRRRADPARGARTAAAGPGRLARRAHPPPRAAAVRVRRRRGGPWPGPSFPGWGSAVPRTELDDRIRKVAEDSGASMLLGVKAVDVSTGFVGPGVGGGAGRRVQRAVPVGDRRRRGPLPVRPDTGPAVASGDGVRGGRARVSGLAAGLGAVDLLGPGTAVGRRAGAARLRLDLPAGQWRGEHRRRGAGHRETARRRGAAAADQALHRPEAFVLGLRGGAAGGGVGACCRWAGRSPGWPGRTGCWSATPRRA